VARQKKKKSKTKRISFKKGRSRKKKTGEGGKIAHALMMISATVLIVPVAVLLLGAIVLGFVMLEKYVSNTVGVSEKKGLVELIGVPEWVNDQLQARIYAAASANGEDLRLDDDAARSVQENLSREIPWLDGVKVETTSKSLQIHASWRKPLAMVKLGSRRFYVDSELVVLDFVPMSKIPIVEIKGLGVVQRIPKIGEVWQREEVEAAVEILYWLDLMDKEVTPKRPLLYEIASIDISNFNGNKNSREAHIILYAQDNTEIVWGAEFGKWQRYLESTDKEKIAKLYTIKSGVHFRGM
jgi:hypothetical protein